MIDRRWLDLVENPTVSIVQTARVGEASHEATASHDETSMGMASAGLECISGDHIYARCSTPGSRGKCLRRTGTGCTYRSLSRGIGGRWPRARKLFELSDQAVTSSTAWTFQAYYCLDSRPPQGIMELKSLIDAARCHL